MATRDIERLVVLLCFVCSYTCVSSSREAIFTSCDIPHVPDVNTTLTPRSNVTISAMVPKHCCCGQDIHSCHGLLYFATNNTSYPDNYYSIRDDNCSSLDDQWHSWFDIHHVNGYEVVIYIVITPLKNGSTNGIQSNDITIQIQGLLGNVTNITVNILCNVILITWDPPPTLDGVPIIQSVLEIDGKNYSSNSTSISLMPQEVQANTIYNASLAAWNEAGEGNVTTFPFNSSTEPRIELVGVNAPVFENSTSVNITVAASLTAVNCSYSLPYNLLAVFTTSDNCTHTFNVSLEDRFAKNDFVQFNFLLVLNRSYDATFTWSNLAGNCTNETYFNTYLFNSTQVTVLENGSIFFFFQFFVLKVPVRRFCLYTQNTDNGEVTTTSLVIDSIVDVISNTTKVMCEGTYSVNYSVLIEDSVISGYINKILMITDAVPCFSSTVYQPTSTVYQPTSTVYQPTSTVSPTVTPTQALPIWIIVGVSVLGIVLCAVCIIVVLGCCYYNVCKKKECTPQQNGQNNPVPPDFQSQPPIVPVTDASLQGSHQSGRYSCPVSTTSVEEESRNGTENVLSTVVESLPTFKDKMVLSNSHNPARDEGTGNQLCIGSEHPTDSDLRTAQPQNSDILLSESYTNASVREPQMQESSLTNPSQPAEDKDKEDSAFYISPSRQETKNATEGQSVYVPGVSSVGGLQSDFSTANSEKPLLHDDVH